MVSLQQLKDEMSKIYILEDKYIVDVMLAAVISNRLPLSDKPVWLLIIGPSSGGKTMILQLLDDIGKWIVPVDTLTTSTFASGFRSVEEEVSLLHKASGGVIVFKDFTTLTSMNEDGLREIMGQMRAIYDGSFNKKTGTKNVDWSGKVGIVAAGTIAVQRKMRQYSEQGERFINYVLKTPDRKDMTMKAIQNQKGIKEKEAYLRVLTGQFIDRVLEKAGEVDVIVPDNFMEKMVDVSNFCTLARSPVILNKKTGKVEWVPDPEMPARMATMLYNLGMTLGLMNEDNQISKANMNAVYKVAFDSIPADRRLVMRILTENNGARTKNIAIRLGYPTETVGSWCNQLTALGIVIREGGGGARGDGWEMKKEFREIVAEYENLKIGEEELIISPEEEEKFMEDEPEDPNDDSLLDQVDWGDWAD